MELPIIKDELGPMRKEGTAAGPVERKSRARGFLFAVASLLILGGLAIGAYSLLMGSPFSPHLTVNSLPNVEGLDTVEASEILNEQGFQVKVMLVKSDDLEGVVLLMDPKGGTPLSAGSEVVLQVATPRIIPEVVKLQEEQAKEVLTQEGFKRIDYIKEKSDEPKGRVLAVEPKEGMEAKAATLITVTVATPYVVPDVIGLDLASAVLLLSKESFQAAQISIYSDEPEGTIVDCDPVAGTELKSRSIVTIFIAKSREAELVAATQNYLATSEGFEVGGTTYELVQPEEGFYEVLYLGSNVTEATVIVIGVTTLPDGEVVHGVPKERTVTFYWNDDNTLASLE